ncbi:Maltodextrin ABC transporter, permease protein MdxF [hydrothermal vent metagenome]|uniref:Maltose/maltodextrin transport system permease protein MalF n=1 Tax=hydrothermal vent metagenome TaxID=652676 RepID=A0A3B0TP78_9ZZZZ
MSDMAINSEPTPMPVLPFALTALAKFAALAIVALALLYVVWGLYLSGEPLFAMVVLSLCVGIITIFGFKRFYTVRFIFPAIAAVLIFIALPVIYTSYVGFTNYSARNLLTFDRVTSQFLRQVLVDKSTQRPFFLVADNDQYRVFLPSRTGEPGGFLSEPIALDGSAATVGVQKISNPPEKTLALRDTIKLRNQLAKINVVLPDGTSLSPSGLRNFASIKKLYRQQSDGSLINQIDGAVLTPDQSQGFYLNQQGETVPPGWRVGVGFKNFKRILFSEGIRQPIIQIFIWTVVFATMSMVLTFSLGILLATILQWPHLKYRKAYRILLILPYAVPAFISILVFRGLFNQNFGEINFILNAVFGVKPSWFTDPNLARTITLIVNTWLGYPYMMLLGMGYLQSVPQEHYKAAALEGAGPVRAFFSITLPQILPPFVPLLIANFSFNFNNVVLILLLTRGMPDIQGTQIPAGQTDILGSFTYRIGFSDSGQNFGMAGAISTLIFIIVGLIAYANFTAMRNYAKKKGVAR